MGARRRCLMAVLAGTAALPIVPAGAQSIEAYFDHWDERVATARATQPDWSSPVVTTTPLLEQRARFDVADQHAGNGAETINIDGGKGVNLIVGETTEFQ